MTIRLLGVRAIRTACFCAAGRTRVLRAGVQKSSSGATRYDQPTSMVWYPHAKGL